MRVKPGLLTIRLVAPALVAPGVAAVTLHAALVLGFIVAVLVVIIGVVAELMHLARRIVAGAGRAVTVPTGFLSGIRREVLAAFRTIMVSLLVNFLISFRKMFSVRVPLILGHLCPSLCK
jgi:hypothetical protein